MQHITRQLIPTCTSLLLREVCVLILKHVQIPYFLHLCFHLDVTYVTYYSSQDSWGKFNFCSATDTTVSHSGSRYSQPTPAIFCTSTPTPPSPYTPQPHTSSGLELRDDRRRSHIQVLTFRASWRRASASYKKPTNIPRLRPRILPQHPQNQLT